MYYSHIMLFGIAGPTASGKTTVTNLLVEKYDADYLRYSMLLSDIATKRGLDPTDKATLQDLYVSLREERGEGWLAEEIANRVEDEQKSENLVIEGNRRKIDIETLKDVADSRNEQLIFIFIDASVTTRFARYNSRLEKQNKPPITFEEFEILEKNAAEDEVDDLRQYAKAHGIYIDTDEHDIKSTENVLHQALSQKLHLF